MKPVEAPFANANAVLSGAQFADSYSMTVKDLNLDAEGAARLSFGRSPKWIKALMRLRNAIVRPFGLKSGAGGKAVLAYNVGVFPVLSHSARRVTLGANDKHLDFRLLVDVEDLGAGRQRVTASTAVKTHNLLGRTYLGFVKPFHRIIVPAMLAQISR